MGLQHISEAVGIFRHLLSLTGRTSPPLYMKSNLAWALATEFELTKDRGQLLEANRTSRAGCAGRKPYRSLVPIVHGRPRKRLTYAF